jgi:hypothetical protein
MFKLLFRPISFLYKTQSKINLINTVLVINNTILCIVLFNSIEN